MSGVITLLQMETVGDVWQTGKKQAIFEHQVVQHPVVSE